jgi:hypothetical protein
VCEPILNASGDVKGHCILKLSGDNPFAPVSNATVHVLLHDFDLETDKAGNYGVDIALITNSNPEWVLCIDRNPVVNADLELIGV